MSLAARLNKLVVCSMRNVKASMHSELWTVEELEEMEKVRVQNPEKNWKEIADLLGNKRTYRAYQAQHYFKNKLACGTCASVDKRTNREFVNRIKSIDPTGQLSAGKFMRSGVHMQFNAFHQRQPSLEVWGSTMEG